MQPTPNPAITIIIPNWNGKDLLKECLQSLREQTFTDFAVLVVDNASSDGSVEMLRESFPEVIIAEMPRNLGFGRAINQGIRRTTSPFVLLLNNDIAVDPHCLESIHGRMQVASDACAGIQCRMMNFYDRTLIDSLGIQIQKRERFHGFYDFGSRLKYGEGFAKPGHILGPCAGAALYRKSFFDAVGLFDERFFAGFEDVDLALRGLRQGWHFKYDPNAVVYHHRSLTLSKLSFVRRTELDKNSFYVAIKNLPLSFWPALALRFLYLLQSDFFNVISLIRKKRLAATLKMYGSVCFHFIPLCLERRHQSITAAELKAIFKASEQLGIW
jgi:GT2 family glycosyltransferase